MRLTHQLNCNQSSDVEICLAAVGAQQLHKICASEAGLCRLLSFSLFLQFGKIILTTSVGIMDHEEARRKKMGGKVS